MVWVKVAGILGFLGVALGAFGAHMLKSKLSEEMFAIYQVGVLYHLIHAIALFALALYGKNSGMDIRPGAWLFVIGIVVFSGSLYMLSFTGIRTLGAITPLGGLSFLLAWAWVVWKL